MAGVTDLPFREICREMGAALTTSEMVTSDTSLWGSEKSRNRLINHSDSDMPASVQIAGSDPDMMAQAAVCAVAHGAQIIDINMGCPAKKVCKKLAGSALMKDEKLVSRILAKVVGSVSVPVTLKTRTGWDKNNKNGIEVARIAESEGIKAITIHGRTRACRFAGEAEYDTIAQIVDTLSIPVFANGDIDTPEKAKAVLECTSAHGIVIGRAAFGNPWIFKQISHFLASGKQLQKPTIVEIASTMTAHFKELYKFYGDYKGTRLARKHFTWYCQQHLSRPTDTIKAFNQLETYQSQLEAVEKLLKRPTIYEEKVA